jgi:hypothetical protein
MPDAIGSRGRHLLLLAWGSAALHGAALVAAATVLRPGSPLAPAADRLAYLVPAPAGWRWGWVLWMLAAGSLVAFLGALVPRLPQPSALILPLAAAGLGVDLVCDAVWMAIVPLAAAGADPLGRLEIWQRLALLGGTVAANGLYSWAVALAAAALYRAGARLAAGLGAAVATAGALLVLVGLAGASALLPAVTAATIGLFALWAPLAARAVRTPAAPAVSSPTVN